MKLLTSMLLVAAGGAIGSILRYGLSLLTQRHAVIFPAGTLAANLLGCFAIGVVMAWATAAPAITPAMRLFLATGICGGFTTMSSFIYEVGAFARDHDYLYAGAYCVATLAGCAALFWLGTALVRALWKG
jgi:CrcB protein